MMMWWVLVLLTQKNIFVYWKAFERTIPPSMEIHVDRMAELSFLQKQFTSLNKGKLENYEKNPQKYISRPLEIHHHHGD